MKMLIVLFFVILVNFSTYTFWSVCPCNTQKSTSIQPNNIGRQLHQKKDLSSQRHLAKQNIGNPKSFLTEVNFRYFRPSSYILQEIYGKSWIDHQIKVSGSLIPKNYFWNRLHIWFAINYASNSGASINGLESTKIQLVPISFGLRFIEPVTMANNNVEVYLGTGFKYYFMDINNKSQFVEPCVNKNNLGGVIETGVYFLASEHVALNFMLDYSFVRFGYPKKSFISNVQRFNLKASSLAVGGGIGFRF